MNKHTPGPWRLSEKWDHIRRDQPPIFWGYFITGSNESGGSILPTLGFVQNFPGNIHANARLIAAAPDLLDALQELDRLLDFSDKRDLHTWVFEDPSGISDAMDKARAAIAKAEGAALVAEKRGDP